MLWFDVTTILRWPYRPVGIVRTELELARWLLDHTGMPASFCRTEGRVLHVVDPDDVRAAILRISSVSEAATVAAAPPSGPGRLTRRLQRLRRTLIRALPRPLARRLIRLLWQRRVPIRQTVAGLRQAYRGALATATYRRQPQTIVSVSRPQPPAPVAAGDTYLSVGLDWDDKDMSVIAELRSRLGVRVVRFCYDLVPVKFPHLAHPSTQRHDPHRFYLQLARNADAIICISDQTRRDFVAFLAMNETPAPPLSVVRLGDSSLAALPAAPLPDSLVGRDYVLYVSTIERRKNHRVLVDAYARLVDNGQRDHLPLLVFAGMPGWGVDELLADIRQDPRLSGLVVLLDAVDDAMLAGLYRHCLFALFPSHYEGWGLGVTEALGFGKFVLVAATGSLPEAGGALVDYVDPLDAPAWAAAISAYAADPDRRMAREHDIRARFTATAWSDTAQQVFGIAASR